MNILSTVEYVGAFTLPILRSFSVNMVRIAHIMTLKVLFIAMGILMILFLAL